MKEKNGANEMNGRRNAELVILFVIAALIVLLAVLYGAKNSGKEYELTILELGGTSMRVQSTSEDLGTGEITLAYSDDMTVQDVNGQIIDLAELSTEDRVRVSIQKDSAVEPVVDRITLLPEGSDEYI